MKYARIHVLPETPPGGLTAGIDWGSADHAVCVVDAAGQVRADFGQRLLADDELAGARALAAHQVGGAEVVVGEAARRHELVCEIW